MCIYIYIYIYRERERERLTVKKECDDVKATSLCNKRNQTNANAQKHKKSQSELANTYLKEVIECIQD